jgi:hypothetical protein
MRRWRNKKFYNIDTRSVMTVGGKKYPPDNDWNMILLLVILLTLLCLTHVNVLLQKYLELI